MSPISTYPYDASKENGLLTGGSGSGLKLKVTIKWNNEYAWNAKWEIIESGTGFYTDETITINRPSSGVPAQVFPNGAKFNITTVEIVDTDTESKSDEPLAGSLNPFDAIADYVQFPDMENKSHQDGPEHEIVYVNEQIDPGTDRAFYTDLAIGGIRINSSKEWTNFTQLSAYFKKGIKVPDLINGGPDKASNNFAEIAYALLTDSNLGAGELVGVNSIGDMSIAAKFCKNNGFTWDGVISNKINLREFLYEHGAYNLLDFTVIGGKFNLVPSVPYKETDYTIDHKANIGKDHVKAMFTDGNIKDLKVSFLHPEEKQVFKANVLYREEKKNNFAETKNLILRLIGTGDNPVQPDIEGVAKLWDKGGSPDDPIETYDLSGFCTTKEAAKKYAKYILKVRKEVDHGLSFKTTPQYVANLKPGDYFRLVSEATHTARYNNGVITKNGDVISKDTITGSKEIYWWEPGTVGVIESEVDFDKKIQLPTQVSTRGVLFTLKNSVTTNRVYKLETIAYAEDGLIDVSGTHAPLTDSGSLAILDGWDGSNPFNHFKEIPR